MNKLLLSLALLVNVFYVGSEHKVVIQSGDQLLSVFLKEDGSIKAMAYHIGDKATFDWFPNTGWVPVWPSLNDPFTYER